jgi:GT2 family glycosyltransferase
MIANTTSNSINVNAERVSAVQSYAKEFALENKGKWVATDRLGGFCLLLKRDVIKRIGPDLDKFTDLSLFDTDILSAKARQAGYNLAVCRDLFVHHFGTRTFAHTAPKIEEAQNPNR